MFVLAALPGCLASTAAACACSCCTLATRSALRSSARVAVSLLFTFSLLFSWALRDYAKPLISRIPWIVRHFAGAGAPPDAWFGQQAVLRLSLGNALLFGGFAFVMAFPGPVRTRGDWRDRGLHHSSYLLKVALWAACSVVPFFLPNGAVAAYALLARAASPLFLGLQVLIIIDAAHAWNDAWVAEGEEDARYLWALLGATAAAYAGVAGAAAAALAYFAPAAAAAAGADCSLNVSLVVGGLLLCVGVSAAALHPRVRADNASASLFVSALVSLYIAYLGFSALQSEPPGYACNGLAPRLGAGAAPALAAGMALTLASTVWAAFRAGSNTAAFSREDTSEPLLGGAPSAELTSAGLDAAPAAAAGMERGAAARPVSSAAAAAAAAAADSEPVPYSYAQFYFVFCLASMYSAMLMTGWGAGGLSADEIDVGWGSVWVKLASQWAAAALYAWTLVAPSVMPDRLFT